MRKWGLVRRRECLVPTRRGWLAALAVLAVLALVGMRLVHPFLAVTQPERGEAMIVEGWLPDFALEKVVAEFKTGNYRQIYTTGVAMDLGGPLTHYTNYAVLSAAILVKMGIPAASIRAVPAPKVKQDRTYTSAVALREWLKTNYAGFSRATVMTEGTHARRSWLLFRKAFGPRVKIGVIAIEPEDYDAARWWTTSQGVRVVISELLAYGYARLLFWPKVPRGP